MSKTDYFWTDVVQASERLISSFVLYDGKPYYVRDIENHSDGCPRAQLRCCETGEDTRKKLNSPLFKKFRELPLQGWYNSSSGYAKGKAVFIARRVVSTRTHGLSSTNVRLHTCRFDQGFVNPTYGLECRIDQLMMPDAGWGKAHRGEYPSLEATLAKIVKGTAVAISNKWCIARDEDGVRWLLHKQDRVGIFTGADTLMLFESYAYLREEMMADTCLTVNTIREF